MKIFFYRWVLPRLSGRGFKYWDPGPETFRAPKVSESPGAQSVRCNFRQETGFEENLRRRFRAQPGSLQAIAR